MAFAMKIFRSFTFAPILAYKFERARLKEAAYKEYKGGGRRTRSIHGTLCERVISGVHVGGNV